MSKQKKHSKREKMKKERAKYAVERKKLAELNENKLAARKVFEAELKRRNIELNYLDGFDSAETLFHRIVDEHKAKIATLADVFEVSDKEFENKDFSRLEIKDLDFIRWNGLGSDYGQTNQPGGRTFGAMLAARTDTGFQTVILIPSLKSSRAYSKEVLYVSRIAVLLHELGHAFDFDQQINFSPLDRIYNVVESEVFAHLYAMNELNRWHSSQVWNFYLCMLSGLKGGGKDAEEILRRVEAQTPEKSFPDAIELYLQTLPA
ncbi:hypothetical protein [Planctomicrobium piriforme]|uniref:Uncharacterized protein n=1 Tax=Planctomicrobium piriforme TaxID=1576369 RepID=A0A1I3QZF9_9PLAN|nr:hypothetical protein [Planctomicrobium piriforme]SFJ38537.1 hypothetical protein SAMN05421753_11981 [Planctomicrobium piriforme]